MKMKPKQPKKKKAVAVNPLNPLRELLAAHAKLVSKNPDTYFELAYTKQAGWMAWLCDKPYSDGDPSRVVLAKGVGDTPDKACEAAVTALKTAPPKPEPAPPVPTPPVVTPPPPPPAL